MMELLRRLAFLFQRRRHARELAEEMEAHRAESEANGRPFAGSLRHREDAREVWGGVWLDHLAQDVRYAFRTLRRAPALTAVALLVLGLGIGVNVAVFSFFNLLVLRPLPLRDPDSLVRLQRFTGPGRAPTPPGGTGVRRWQGYSSDLPFFEMDFLRRHATTLAAVLPVAVQSLTRDTGEIVLGHFVTPAFFQELGAAAAAGRLSTEPAQPVAILSYAYWERAFASDPQIIGRTLRLNGLTVPIAGVTARSFSGLAIDSPNVWLPLDAQPQLVAGSRLFAATDGGLNVWARLQPGATMETARQELGALVRQLRTERPKAIWESEVIALTPAGFAVTLDGEAGQIFALAGTLVLLLLAVACANLGGLMLARGVARQREMFIRSGVGAGRPRLIRQILTESLVLGLAGAATGLALGYAAFRVILAYTQAPRWFDPSPDWHTFCYAALLALAATAIFGIPTAFQAGRPTARAYTLRKLMVAAQVAACCVLLIVTTLLVRGIHRLNTADPGFDFQNVIAIRAPSGKPAQQLDFLERLRQLPGVSSAARASTPPLGNVAVTFLARAAGRAPGIRDVFVYDTDVTPDYFETLRLPLRRGRNFMPGDTHAVIVSESLAQRLWPGEDPLGRQLTEGDTEAELERNPRLTVIGVCGSTRLIGRSQPDPLELYHPAEEASGHLVTLARLRDDAQSAVLPAIRELLRAIDPHATAEIQPLRRSFERQLEAASSRAAAVGALGLSALALACLGIAGVVSFTVSQRTREFGIRLALGARPAQMLSLVLRQFYSSIAAGLAAGIVLAALVSQLLRAQFPGTGSFDPLAYTAAALLLVAVALAAALFPARRALRADPLVSLRND